MAVVTTKYGGVSTAFPSAYTDSGISKSSGGARSGGGSGGKSSISTPTPSASELYGTEAQKEAQIRAFQSGGQAAFEAEKQMAIEESKKPTTSTAPTLTPSARTISSQLGTKPSIPFESYGMSSASIKVPTATGSSSGSYGTQTRTDLSPVSTTQVFTQPTIYKKEIGTEEYNVGGTYKNIPTVGTFYFGPEEEGSNVWVERRATQEEEQYYRKQTNVLIASEGTAPKGFGKVKSDILSGWDIAQSRVREVYTEPTIGKLFKKINYEPEKTDLGVTTRYLESKGVPSIFAKSGEFLAGAGLGILEDIRKKPLKQAAIYGVSLGAGALTGIASSGLSAIPKVGGYLGSGIKFTTYGAGVLLGGSYAIAKGGEIISAPTPAKAGEIFGTTGKDIFLGYAGYSAGTRISTGITGFLYTRGRNYIEIPQGEFPSAKPSKQLSMFKRNIIPEFGEEAGAFHTTPKKFWKGEIIPIEGTSELSGLYGSTKISTPFSKIKGSYGKYKLLPSFEDFTVGKPAVAYIKPSRFAEGKYKWVNAPVFKGQKSVRGKYAEWITPAEEGAAYVPKMKSEIEAIYRKGSFTLESKKFYTKISGVRVPIDVFGYKGGTTITPITKPTGTFGTGKYSSYSLPRQSYSLNPPILKSGYSSSIKPYSYSSINLPSVSKPSVAKQVKTPISSSSVTKKLSRTYPSSLKSSLSSFTSPSSASSSILRSNVYIPPFQIPKPKKIKFKERSKSKKQLFRQPNKYVPSFTASILRIRTKKTPKNYFERAFGALQVRAVPINTDTRKRLRRARIF